MVKNLNCKNDENSQIFQWANIFSNLSSQEKDLFVKWHADTVFHNTLSDAKYFSMVEFFSFSFFF